MLQRWYNFPTFHFLTPCRFYPFICFSLFVLNLFYIPPVISAAAEDLEDPAKEKSNINRQHRYHGGSPKYSFIHLKLFLVFYKIVILRCAIFHKLDLELFDFSPSYLQFFFWLCVCKFLRCAFLILHFGKSFIGIFRTYFLFNKDGNRIVEKFYLCFWLRHSFELLPCQPFLMLNHI